MNVDDVISARAEFDHALEIRAIGPALVIVLELQAPPRIHALASTRGEGDVLRAEVESNPSWGHILADYFSAEERLDGSNEHLARLAAGDRLRGLRVAG
ncbi:MAG TPA: hypothetical protein VFM96_02830 [Gaiellaceae bacterium]|nr:hypothetical protein [Gaiellaceae bacterium]